MIIKAKTGEVCPVPFSWLSPWLRSIRERKAELDEIKEQITVQEIKNEEMQKLYDSTGSDFSTLAEQIARDDLDYVKEGERVFVNVSGE